MINHQWHWTSQCCRSGIAWLQVKQSKGQLDKSAKTTNIDPWKLISFPVEPCNKTEKRNQAMQVCVCVCVCHDGCRRHQCTAYTAPSFCTCGSENIFPHSWGASTVHVLYYKDKVWLGNGGGAVRWSLHQLGEEKDEWNLMPKDKVDVPKTCPRRIEDNTYMGWWNNAISFSQLPVWQPSLFFIFFWCKFDFVLLESNQVQWR